MEDAEALRVLERRLVHNCAPTLAGIKPASLFVCRARRDKPCTGDTVLPMAQLGRAIQRLRKRLAPYGIQIEPMSAMRTGLLIIVYRPALLAGSLASPVAARFLAGYGYAPTSLGSCLGIWSLEHPSLSRFGTGDIPL